MASRRERKARRAEYRGLDPDAPVPVWPTTFAPEAVYETCGYWPAEACGHRTCSTEEYETAIAARDPDVRTGRRRRT